MNIKTIQDILPFIEQPSQYLGSEINRIKKAPEDVKLRFALAFPDLYEIGTSHFGIQILYNILNSHKDIAAERVFAPGEDTELYLRNSEIPVTSLESRTPLDKFDIIGFSLLYELNFTNILTILDLAGIPFFASRRDASHPFIIAGGPCTCNPEPLADFFDAMVIGDGESVIMEISKVWLDYFGTGHPRYSNQDKEAILKKWSEIEGVYVPSYFKPAYISIGSVSGIQTLAPEFSDYIKVTRRIVNNLDNELFPDTPILPYGKPVHDRLRLEVARGCTRGCRFCQAGIIYRPVRERSLENLLSLAERSAAKTGYEDISLLSLSTGDYSDIVPLMERLMNYCEAEHIAVSFPSLRAGTLTPELMNLVKRVRKTGFTIAPEAGSQRLRDVINKNISEKDIFDTVYDAFNLGWQVIKLYFMIGLPTETDEDIQAIIALADSLGKIRAPKGRKGKINVSVGTFIPKPHTPFQWASQISLAKSKDIMYEIQDELKRMPAIQFKWQKPEVSLLEGLWARGDRRLSSLLVTAYKKGCKFDGWSDKFQYYLWEEAFSEEGTDVDFYTTRARDIAEPLPWDHIDIRVSKAFLQEEWNKALSANLTEDCRNGDCHGCGVCDFEAIEPRLSGNRIQNSGFRILNSETSSHSFKKLRVMYSKQGNAKYFGHLEMMKIFLRAIRRVGIQVKFSEGFHPMPKVSFEDPLPIGMESLNETMFLTVPENIHPQKIVEGLNRQLPEGLAVHDCQPALTKTDISLPKSVEYQITLKNEAVFDEKRLKAFTDSSDFIITRVNYKGNVKDTDLKEMVLKTDISDADKLKLTLKSEPGKSIRPAEVIKEIFKLSDEEIKLSDIVKK